ncbi:MAG: glycosyl hydrolase family 39 [Acidobacteria bacterium]|nr:MAG: glycosyl hydrolase family 39 [Acidobacteriota bacterium]
MSRRRRLSSLTAVAFGVFLGPALAQPPLDKVPVQWDKVTRVSKTIPTLQVVVNPPLRRGSAIHDNAFKALRDLQADYVRYVPWLPYPKLGVAELEPPKDGATSWDFSLIDPMTIDFLEATTGHPVILNFSTIPQWMARTEKPVSYPADPDQAVWDYTQGTEFRDPTFKEVADYYARLLAWYTQGGFTDELGRRHESGHRYPIPIWEVLNEVDFEHSFSPEDYTRLYDAVVAAMRRVQPGMKFVGTALAIPARTPEFFEYFLNHANHKAGIPLDYISYHFYAIPVADQSPEVQQHTFFTQADGFLTVVRYVEVIRKRLSPETGTMINEIGAISADDLEQDKPGHVAKPIPDSYWNLAGALYAYLFGELTRMGIDVAGESQLVGYPTQFPSVTMVDWTTGQPNARYQVLRLLHDNFGPGDKLVANAQAGPFPPALANYVFYQGFLTRDGKRRLLLVNKRDRTIEVSVPGASGGREDVVDQTTASGPPASRRLDGETVSLGGYAVAVVTLP